MIADLEAAGEQGDARRSSLQAALEQVEERISEVETELMEVVPEWEDRVGAEKEERER